MDFGKIKGIQYIAPFRDSCYDEETEVLTDRGWLYFKDLTYEHKLCTLNEKHEIEYHNPSRIIIKKWDGKMYKLFSKAGIDLLVTPDHSMYCTTEHWIGKGNPSDKWKFEKAEEGFGKRRFFKKDGNWVEKGLPTNIEIAGRLVKTDDWMEFLGYYLSEGSSTLAKGSRIKKNGDVPRTHYIVQIRQLHKPTLRKMAECLSKVTNGKINIRPDGRVVVNDKSLCLYLKNTFGDKYNKHIPRYLLNNASKKQLSILFEALMLGDGHDLRNKSISGIGGGSSYCTSSIKLRDDFLELLLKVGYGGSYIKKYSKGDIRYIYDRKYICKEDHWVIRIRFKYNICSKNSGYKNKDRNKTIEEYVDYSGFVYCATVKNHTLFVRRNGCSVWCGNSGYARASREYLSSLLELDIPLRIKTVTFETHKPDLSGFEKVLDKLENKNIEYNVNIIHLTPEHIPLFKEDGKFNINLTVWETDRIHQDWVQYCNNVDSIIVPCTWNKKVFKDSGVNTNIGVVPHTINLEKFDNIKEKAVISGVNDEFKFYCVGQWQQRKYMDGLLRAYYAGFAGNKDVALVLKTYKDDSSRNQLDVIANVINAVKINSSLYKKDYPKVVVIGDVVSDDDMVKLHNSCDCYISTAHSEGWGLGYFEAMAAGKPTIGVGGSGNEDFMNDSNSYIINYTWSPVYGMPFFRWYDGEQFWPEPDLKHTVQLMKHVYNNRHEAALKGIKAAKDIRDNYSYSVVGRKLISEINGLMV